MLIYLWLSINHKYVLITKLKVCMSCTGIMYVHYRVNWYPEPVFVTYPLPQEGKDPDRRLYSALTSYMARAYYKSCIDVPSQFPSISCNLTSRQQLGCISSYKVNWKKSGYTLCTGVTNKIIRGNSVKVLMTWWGAACLFSWIMTLPLSSSSWEK